MFPHLLRFELGVEDGELREHAHVSPLQAQRGLQQRDKFLEVSAILIVADQVFQLVGVDDDVKAADLCQTELLPIHARKAHLGIRDGYKLESTFYLEIRGDAFLASIKSIVNVTIPTKYL